MIIRSRAPVRIDFAGGWTDVALFCQETPGYVVNAAINLYSYVTVTTPPMAKITNGINIYDADLEQYVEADDIRALEYSRPFPSGNPDFPTPFYGTADLAKAAVKLFGGRGVRTQTRGLEGIDLETYSIAPPGSGLGTSAAMGVALCGALGRAAGKNWLPFEYAEMACRIEQEELGILGGKQDQYASALGGFNVMEFNGDKVTTNRLPLRKEIIYELEANLLLCYTGTSRLSGNIHQQVVAAFRAGENVDTIETLKDMAKAMQYELMAGHWSACAAIIEANWRLQQKLHPAITTPEMIQIYVLARRYGATAGKACGAGGGGCMVFYCPGTKPKVRKKLQVEGIQVIDFTFNDTGLQVWEVSTPPPPLSGGYHNANLYH